MEIHIYASRRVASRRIERFINVAIVENAYFKTFEINILSQLLRNHFRNHYRRCSNEQKALESLPYD